MSYLYSFVGYLYVSGIIVSKMHNNMTIPFIT